MAPKSSDEEVRDGSSSSSNPESMDSMELATDVAVSLLGKRRAETPNPEDSGESDDGVQVEIDEEDNEGDEYCDDIDVGEENSESDEKEEDKELQWGYDSFDNIVYDSSNECVYADKEFEEQSRCYGRRVIQTQGFFESSEGFPSGYLGGICPISDLEEVCDDGLSCREFCAKLASTCLEKYNEEEGLNVKLDHVLWANFTPNAMSKFYITFAARASDCPDAPLVEYQAKVVWTTPDKTYPLFCRPSPFPKEMVKEIN